MLKDGRFESLEVEAQGSCRVSRAWRKLSANRKRVSDFRDAWLHLTSQSCRVKASLQYCLTLPV
jgi:hypothetical protein